MTEPSTGVPGGRTGGGGGRAAGRGASVGRAAGGRRRGEGRKRDIPAPPGSGGLDEEAALALLSGGELEVEGRLVVASNATLYCMVRLDGAEAACV